METKPAADESDPSAEKPNPFTTETLPIANTKEIPIEMLTSHKDIIKKDRETRVSCYSESFLAIFKLCKALQCEKNESVQKLLNMLASHLIRKCPLTSAELRDELADYFAK